MVQGLIIDASEHPIQSVTVYKSSQAEVVRTFAIELKAGQHKLEIKTLPSCIHTDSVRVSGLGNARLYDVTCTTQKDIVPARQSSAERIRALNAQLKMLERQKSLREAEAKILARYGESLTAEHIAPDATMIFLGNFIEQGHKNTQELKQLEEEIVSIQRQIAEETENSKKKKGEADARVTVVVATEVDGPVELKLNYIVTDVRWESTYELHAKNVDGHPSEKISLNYRARVTQSTGEDWSETALVLSTATLDTLVKSVPKLDSISIKPPSQSLFGSNMARETDKNSQSRPAIFGGFGQSSSASHDTRASMPASWTGTPFGSQAKLESVQQPPATPLSEASTIVSESPLSLTYSVEGRSTVPSDGVAHQVLVATLPFESKTSYMTVPRAEASAYLQCSVKNTSDYRLLSGHVNVFLDDSFVSKASIKDVNAGDTFECTFGVDPLLHITHTRSSKMIKGQGSAYSETRDETIYTVKTLLKNKHRSAIQGVIVQDAVPVVSDENRARFSVVLRKPVELVDTKAGETIDYKLGDGTILKLRWAGVDGEKEGKYEWECDLEPEQELTLETEFRISAPAGTQWRLA